MFTLKIPDFRHKLKDRRYQGLIGIVILILFFFAIQISKRAQAEKSTWVRVEKGEFVIDMTETGEIQAVNAVVLTVPTESNIYAAAGGGGRGGGGGSIGATQILELIPEGTSVKKGDILVRLDPGTIEDSIISTLENIEQMESDLENLYRTHEEETKTIARNLQKAEYSREAAKLTIEKMKFEERSIQEEREFDLKKQMLALELIEKNAEATRLRQALDLERSNLRLLHRREYLSALRTRLENTVISAPMDGIVVYGTIGRGPNARKINVGTTVSPGDVLIRIPDLSRMRMVAHVNEIDVDRFRAGQHVEIRLDAYEDMVLKGSVEYVAPMITSNRDLRGFFRPNVAVPEEAPTFEVSVFIEETSDFLKPGITAQGRVIIETIPDAVFIPIGSVYEDTEGRTVVFPRKNYPQPVEVKLGFMNALYAVVESGLEGDELVSRTSPDAFAFFPLGWNAEMERRRSELAELVRDIEMMRELGLTGAPAR